MTDQLFGLYEPRPEYTLAAPVTHENVRQLAEDINRQRYYGKLNVVALVYPSAGATGSDDFLILYNASAVEDGALGDEIGRAYPHRHYIKKTDTGYEIVDADEHRRANRKCVGDDR